MDLVHANRGHADAHTHWHAYKTAFIDLFHLSKGLLGLFAADGKLYPLG